MNFKPVKRLLLPLAALYNLITATRNCLYDCGFKRSVFFSAPYTIVLGNLTVGGTGKTPHTAFLLRFLSRHFSSVMLSRGYGRKTKGYRLATRSDTADQIGDEPLQIFNTFSGKIPVAVCERRVAGIRQILSDLPQTEVVVLDDAFQHRALRPTLKILISSYHQPFYEDFLLPMGLLRESRKNVRRSRAVIVSKVPPLLSELEKKNIREKIWAYHHKKVPVFFSGIRYGKPYDLQQNKPITITDQRPICLLTSIANPSQMQDDLRDRLKLNILENLPLPDHQTYNAAVIAKIFRVFGKIEAKNTLILTTEKDAAKLKHPAVAPKVADLPIGVLPIEVDMHEEQSFYRFLEKQGLMPN